MSEKYIPIIASVIITYNPDNIVFQKLLKAIKNQVDYIIVVDNGSIEKIYSDFPNPSKLKIFFKGFNSGIAAAINTGILEAKKLNVTHIVLFDQDSIPAPDMVKALISSMNQKKNEGYKVAAVGANYSDIKGQYISPFVKLNGFMLSRVNCNHNEIVSVDHLISSGSLIDIEVLTEIGGMEEQLFIDYVDTEWCLRAIHKGYSIFGVGSAYMEHDLGDNQIKLLNKTLTVHSAIRYYYLMRNGIWLLHQPWVSSSWRLMDMRRLFLIYIVCSLFVSPRFKNWKMMTLGLWHGLTNRMGKL
jgi:rhamnosyltransferase